MICISGKLDEQLRICLGLRKLFAQLVILDEATSALDNITQKHVSDSLAALKCTRIVIAHRLSTIRNCDKIIVLDSGKIVEEGNFDTLIANQGAFYDLAKRQIV